jgi:hypothetical protein
LKLYTYSSELLTFVDADWAKAKFTTCGILIGAVLFFGFMKLNQSGGTSTASRSAVTLAAENDLLRSRLSLISPRVSNLEMQTARFNERINNLLVVLRRSRAVGDEVSLFMNVNKEIKPQSVIPTVRCFRP